MIVVDGLKHKKVAVFGLGKSGLATVKSLCASGAECYVWDDNEAGRDALKKLALETVTVEDPHQYDWNSMEALVLSPGVPFTHPEPHYIVKLAQSHDCPVVCDIELLYLAHSDSCFVGITGTNGKSTTTTLIGHVLVAAKYEVAVGGNLGIPVLELENLSNEGIYVLEMSSYQLDLIDKMHFSIGILLNITPDHLDRHGGMEGYIAAKERMFNRMGNNDVAVIGVDDASSKDVYGRLVDSGKIGKIVPLSVEKKLDDGVSVIDGVIYDNYRGNSGVMELNDLPYLRGKHNAQNIAASYVVLNHLGLQDKAIVDGVKSFKGLRHRMQLVKETQGVLFVNDSKATNAEAASKALSAYDQIYWILGGISKEGGIDSLREYYSKVKRAYLIGESQEDFFAALDGEVDCVRCGTLESAFDEASKDALNSGAGVVLLSPACASFDQWANFELRGDAFCDLVEKL